MTAGPVLVTGGAGFIGGAVVAALVGAGREVGVLDNLRPDVHRDDGRAATVRLDSLGVELVRGDVRDAAEVRDALRGKGCVVHLAAKVGLGVGIDDIDDYVSSNDLGTAVLLREAATSGVRVVQASSMVVYGEGRYTCPDHGDVPPGPRRRESLDEGVFEPPCPLCGRSLTPGLVTEDARLDPRNVYASTKVTQEQLAAAWCRETRATAVSLRLHNVYGPGMPRDTPYAGVAAMFLSGLLNGQAPRVFEDGRQRRDFVHVADVADAFVAALDADLDEQGGGHHAYNVGSGVVTTIGEMATALSAATSGPTPVVTGEYRLGDVRHVTASSALAGRELGWAACIPLADGVRGLVG